MTNINFKKVQILPTSGFSVGDVYFVSEEKKIYIRTSLGWEDYGGAQVTGEAANFVMIDLSELPVNGSKKMSLDIFNKLAAGAESKTPMFGYSKVPSTMNESVLYQMVPLSVFYGYSSVELAIHIQYTVNNKCVEVRFSQANDTECTANATSHSSLLASYVNSTSERAVQSSAVWKEIHAEPMTINASVATFEVTLSSSSNHKIILYTASGTQTYALPASPLEGETFVFLKVMTGNVLVIKSIAGNDTIFDCATGTTITSKSISGSTKCRITVTYSNGMGKWLIMCDNFTI